MPSPLDNLVTIGKLKTEPPAQSELDGLLRSGAARIKDAENASLSLESRFDLAYNAAHAFSLAALRHRGYRSDFVGLGREDAVQADGHIDTSSSTLSS